MRRLIMVLLEIKDRWRKKDSKITNKQQCQIIKLIKLSLMKEKIQKNIIQKIFKKNPILMINLAGNMVMEIILTNKIKALINKIRLMEIQDILTQMNKIKLISLNYNINNKKKRKTKEINLSQIINLQDHPLIKLIIHKIAHALKQKVHQLHKLHSEITITTIGKIIKQILQKVQLKIFIKINSQEVDKKQQRIKTRQKHRLEQIILPVGRAISHQDDLVLIKMFKKSLFNLRNIIQQKQVKNNGSLYSRSDRQCYELFKINEKYIIKNNLCYGIQQLIQIEFQKSRLWSIFSYGYIHYKYVTSIRAYQNQIPKFDYFYLGHDGKNNIYNLVPKYSGVISALRDIYQNQGFKGLYKGYLLSFVSQAIAQGIFFTIYEKRLIYYERILKKNHMDAVTYASIQASFFGAVITQPLWIIKTRMVLNVSNNILQKHNFYHNIKQIYKQHGITGFYRGLMLNIVLCFNGVFQMYFYEGSKMIYEYQIDYQEKIYEHS